MAFTTPRTWTDGELVNAAIMNAHVRDNFSAMGPNLIARKTGDESRTSTTLANDATLFTPSIPANEVWLLELIYTVQTSTSDMKVALTFPSGTIRGNVQGVANSYLLSGSGTVTNTAIPDSNNVSPGYLHTARAVFANGATPGAVTFQWASSTGVSVTLHANSTLWGVKLA